MTVRLIASDLDGTLFGSNSVPEPRTVAAVNAVVQAGFVFAAVTGRSHFGGAERVTNAGAKAHWFIGSNGGHRLDIGTGILEERLLFSAADLAVVQAELNVQLPGIGFGLEHVAGFTYDDGFRAAFPNAFDGGPRKDTTSWANDDVGKIFITHPDLTSDELIEAATPLVPAGTHVTTSGTAFVELTPAGADKALGVERLCDKLGFGSDQVIAFGDNNNDLTMLAWAGRGIAMANATPQVLDAATEVTGSNVDFGVAQILETLLE